MSVEPWIVRTALTILAINAVNGLLFLAVHRLQNRRNSAASDADTPVTTPRRRLHVPSPTA